MDIYIHKWLRLCEPLVGWVSVVSNTGDVLLQKCGWEVDFNWNWRAEDFRYSPARATKDPDYIGSYCMDNLSMALHCVWSTETFEAAALKAANLCGDADTVAAVVGQLAGAIYGASAIPKSWIDHLRRWDGGDIVLKSWLLYHRTDEALLGRCVRQALPFRIRDMFRQFDSDNDGSLSHAELMCLLQSLDEDQWSDEKVKPLFAGADVNKDAREKHLRRFIQQTAGNKVKVLLPNQ